MKNIGEVNIKEAVIFGCIACIAGGVIILRALNIIQAGELKAPAWVVGVAGFAFLTPGMFMIYYGIRNTYFPPMAYSGSDPSQINAGIWLLGSITLTCFGAIASWVAFGPGKREFQSSLSFFGYQLPFLSGESFGRAVFGIGAVFVDVLAAGDWVWGIRHFLKKLR